MSDRGPRTRRYRWRQPWRRPFTTGPTVDQFRRRPLTRAQLVETLEALRQWVTDPEADLDVEERDMWADQLVTIAALLDTFDPG